MTIDFDNEHIDFSLSQKNTMILQRVAETPLPEIPPMRLRTPKKTRLERLPLSETTSPMMLAIRKVRAERLPEYFEQTCGWRQHQTAVICGSSQLTYQELDQRANRLAHFLISRGVEKGYPIGILLERSLDIYIAFLMKLLVIFNMVADILTLWLSYAFISGELVDIGCGWMLDQSNCRFSVYLIYNEQFNVIE